MFYGSNTFLVSNSDSQCAYTVLLHWLRAYGPTTRGLLRRIIINETIAESGLHAGFMEELGQMKVRLLKEGLLTNQTVIFMKGEEGAWVVE